MYTTLHDFLDVPVSQLKVLHIILCECVNGVNLQCNNSAMLRNNISLQIYA